MNQSKMTIPELLRACSARINNTINDATILNYVSLFGYTSERMEQGKQLLNAGESLCIKFEKEHGEVAGAYDTRNQKQETADKHYQQIKAICNVALKNDKTATIALLLNKKTPRTLSGWLNHTRSFYNNLLSNQSWIDALALFNINAETINQGLQSIKEVEQYADVILREKGDAQQATKDRDAAIDELAEWVSDYESIAKLALVDKPQLLEKLGIVVAS